MNPCSDLTALFGADVFNEATMQRRLKPEIYRAWKQCVAAVSPLTLETADQIAQAMKLWAVEKGATHYTHWFQPMTGITAEKHDSFLCPASDGRAILSFTGKALVQGEPDASSFPSGGLRATFEARGYTAWDPTAFAFVKDGSLYIPTCFFSYTGDALDKKTPLLRSLDALSRQAVRVLRLFGDSQTQRVRVSVGPEQEYFLIPKALYEKREDLRLTGRTLFGAPAPKGQELEDHYFGSIRPQVAAFMQDVEMQLWRLGIPAKTKHNEVAPCQHELATVYADAANACDANQLVMDILKKSAPRHGLVCLLHEKPFAGINGSGKHNNWSICTDSGKNLFTPGETPRQNAQFLLFLAAFLQGIDEYADFLRCTVAYAGNDHRLGANEAPPAILSVSLGEELTAVIHSIVDGGSYADPEKPMMRIGVDVLPPIPRDTTDRNRTSPVAFTGNKFEFRMPGASQSVAGPNIALNTIMAEELGKFADALESAGDLEEALQTLICESLTAHRRILFNGDGYSQAWQLEAQRRGLHRLSSSADALPVYASDQNAALVTRHGIFSPAELRARSEIHLENYGKVVCIEAKTALDMAMGQILPAALDYSAELAQATLEKKQLGASCLSEQGLIRQLSAETDRLYDRCQALRLCLSRVPEAPAAAAEYCRSTLLPEMEGLRACADRLEPLMRKDRWPFPTYSDLLFY